MLCYYTIWNSDTNVECSYVWCGFNSPEYNAISAAVSNYPLMSDEIRGLETLKLGPETSLVVLVQLRRSHTDYLYKCH